MRLAPDMLEFRDQLAERGVILNYSGFITEDILGSVAKALRSKLELDGKDKGTSRRVFAIFVELFQNVIRYSAEHQVKADPENPVDLRYGLLTIGEDDSRHFICCCNLISRRDVRRLDDALSEIKGMDADALKHLYKTKLRSETPKTSKGAGVGFIEIARQAPHGFDFDFADVDADHAYFCLKAYV